MSHSSEPVQKQPPRPSVASCLDAAVLSSATVVCGHNHLETAVTWVSVIEWPIENFVSPGDFVLTTGMGCDAERLALFVEETARAGAAAVCLSVGVGSNHQTLPAVVEESARRHGVVLVTIPWEVRFSDIARAIIDMLYLERSRSNDDHTDDLPSAFTRALLDTGGIQGIAHALEGVTGMAAFILDVAGVVVGHGPLAEDVISTESHQRNALMLLRSRIDDPELTTLRRVDDDAWPLVLMPVQGRHRLLGWVAVVEPRSGVAEPASGADLAPDAVEDALRHGATACAIELLRQEAAEEFGTRARGQFMWWVAGTEAITADELAARSALLGYPMNAELRVALGLVEGADHGASSIHVAAEVARRLRWRSQYPTSVITHRDSEILVCLDHREPSLESLLDDPALAPFTHRVTWGLARGAHHLAALAEATAQARTAVAVTRATLGPGKLAGTDELGPFMLLNGLASDQVATHIAREVVGPLERADRERNSDLLGTLAVYLAENGNVSSAARRLHLNRHSLLYRLRRVEELTGRSLDCHDDRLLLDISMRVRRLHPT